MLIHNVAELKAARYANWWLLLIITGFCAVLGLYSNLFNKQAINRLWRTTLRVLISVTLLTLLGLSVKHLTADIGLSVFALVASIAYFWSRMLPKSTHQNP